MYSFSYLESVCVPCPVLTVASWPAYRFLKRQVRWSGIPISFRIFHSLLWIHTVIGFGIVNKAETDGFLELSCFFDDPVDVGNLISGSSAFSKTSSNIWKFTVHVLLKPGLENFEHYFTSVWNLGTWSTLELAHNWVHIELPVLWSSLTSLPLYHTYSCWQYPRMGTMQDTEVSRLWCRRETLNCRAKWTV